MMSHDYKLIGPNGEVIYHYLDIIDAAERGLFEIGMRNLHRDPETGVWVASEEVTVAKPGTLLSTVNNMLAEHGLRIAKQEE